MADKLLAWAGVLTPALFALFVWIGRKFVAETVENAVNPVRVALDGLKTVAADLATETKVTLARIEATNEGNSRQLASLMPTVNATALGDGRRQVEVQELGRRLDRLEKS